MDKSPSALSIFRIGVNKTKITTDATAQIITDVTIVCENTRDALSLFFSPSSLPQNTEPPIPTHKPIPR